MVNKQKMLFAAVACASLTASAAMPAWAGYAASDPSPLKQGSLVRLLDVATTQNVQEEPTVAVGWRSGGNPGSLFMSFSTDGGATYRRGNGNFRQFAVAGKGKLGLSLGVCGDAVWAGSAANFPGDNATDTDVLVTRRAIGGAAAQAFVTAPSARRKVRDVSIACVGTNLLAIAWLEKAGGKTRARLLVRDQNSLAPSATSKSFFLGNAIYNGGITVAATAKSIHVVWTAGSSRNVRYKRFLVGNEANPSIRPKGALTLAKGDATRPQVAVHGQRVVAAYSDAGKAVMRISTSQGVSFQAPQTIISAGTVKKPSRVHSVDVFGQRIVLEGVRSANGKSTSQRHESTDSGATWSTRSFGHKGPRMGALRKSGPGTSSLAEAWLNNAATDTLRAQHETP